MWATTFMKAAGAFEGCWVRQNSSGLGLELGKGGLGSFTQILGVCLSCEVLALSASAVSNGGWPRSGRSLILWVIKDKALMVEKDSSGHFF